MTFAAAIRAWLGSVVACVVLLMAWVAVMQLLSGRMTHLVHNAVDVSIGFGGIFALTAAVVYVPTFVAVRAFLGRWPSRTTAALLGAALAPVAYLAIAWRFRESEGPQTLTALLQYWVLHLPEFAFGSLPFALAGAVFGILWSGGRHRASD
jgi:hypothetical protein